MAHLPPLSSSTGTAPAKPNTDDDIDEDSLAESISEHIEIESGDEDGASSNSKAINAINQNKRRQLFGIDDEDIAPRFGFHNDNLDNLLSGDNIAQHFKVDDINANDESDADEEEDAHDDKENTDEGGENVAVDTHQRSDISIGSKNSSNPKLDEKVTVGGAESLRTDSIRRAEAGGSSADGGEDHSQKGAELQDDDVILINDNEISIKSLKNQQTGEISATQSNQNTTSDVSDLVNENDDDSISVEDMEQHDRSEALEEIVKSEQKEGSISEKSKTLSKHSNKSEDLSKHSIADDEKSDAVRSVRSHTSAPRSEVKENSQSVVSERMAMDTKHKLESNTASDNQEIRSIINKAIDHLPLDPESEDGSPSAPDKDIKDIINEAIDSLPIKQCVRISRDSLSEIPEDDEELTIEIIEEASDFVTTEYKHPAEGPKTSTIFTLKSETKDMETAHLDVSKNNNGSVNNVTDLDNISLDTIRDLDSPRARSDSANLMYANELNINLVHMQNKIKELQDLTAGKYNCMIPTPSIFNIGAASGDGFSSSRRDSLKDQPQSGRDSTSIATNSTEYRTFQEEYFNLTKVGL